MIPWRDQIPELEELRRSGKSFSECGQVLGRSRSSVAKAVWAYILGHGHGTGAKPPRIRQTNRRPIGSRWDERALTETYAERKARLKRERAE